MILCLGEDSPTDYTVDSPSEPMGPGFSRCDYIACHIIDDGAHNNATLDQKQCCGTQKLGAYAMGLLV